MCNKELSYHKEVSRAVEKGVDGVQVTQLGQYVLQSNRNIQFCHTGNKSLHKNGTAMSLHNGAGGPQNVGIIKEI
jgi:hypothetical protein